MDFAFPFVARGSSSSTARGYVPESSGDPNYYASAPAFDVRGYWHAAGTNPPPAAPAGQPDTPAGGNWVAQGHVTGNGRKTTRWVYYPPNGSIMTSGKVGSIAYTFSRKLMDGGARLFLNPDYWIKSEKVPPKPSSSYSPQYLGASGGGSIEPPDGIVPVTGTFHCSKWMLVATDKGPTIYAGLSGAMFTPRDVFRFYTKVVGLSPYFTYRGFLFKFEFAGKESVVNVCVDGMNVQTNPPGSSRRSTVFAPGGSGGALVVHARGTGLSPLPYQFYPPLGMPASLPPYSMPVKTSLVPGAMPVLASSQVAMPGVVPSASPGIPTQAIVVGTILGGIFLGGIAFLLTEG